MKALLNFLREYGDFILVVSILLAAWILLWHCALQ